MKATRRNPIHTMNKMFKALIVAVFAMASVSCCHHHHAYHHAAYGYHSYNNAYYAPSYGGHPHGFAAAHHRR